MDDLENFPIVETVRGTVQGRRCLDYYGRPYYSFVRVPYAICPTGDERFNYITPVSGKLWNTVLDCTHEQIHNIRKFAFVEERCLYVNIYTPKLASGNANPASLLPVMVFLAGTSEYMSWRHDLEHFGPQYLVNQDIVVVVVSYRSGILGFAKLKNRHNGTNHNGTNCPGYAAYNDVTQAMSFITMAIANFGGNYFEITAWGQGSGAALLCDALFHPVPSTTMIRRMILQSINGSLWIGRQGFKVKDYAVFSKLVDKNVSEEKALKVLRRIPLHILLKHEDRYLQQPKFRYLNFKFMDKFGEIEMAKGGSLDAIMIGYNSHEGLIDAYFGKENYRMTVQQCKAKCVKMLSNLNFGSGRALLEDGELKDYIANRIAQKFFPNNNLRQSNLITRLVEMATDMNHLIETVLSLRQLPYYIGAENFKLYFYRFNVDGEMNLTKNLIKMKAPGSSCHGDELGYLFQVIGNPKPKPGSMEELTMQRMTSMWANFARSSNPTPQIISERSACLGDFIWEPCVLRPDNVQFKGIVKRVLVMSRMNHCNISNTQLSSRVVIPELTRMTFWYSFLKYFLFIEKYAKCQKVERQPDCDCITCRKVRNFVVEMVKFQKTEKKKIEAESQMWAPRQIKVPPVITANTIHLQPIEATCASVMDLVGNFERELMPPPAPPRSRLIRSREPLVLLHSPPISIRIEPREQAAAPLLQEPRPLERRQEQPRGSPRRRRGRPRKQSTERKRYLPR